MWSSSPRRTRWVMSTSGSITTSTHALIWTADFFIVPNDDSGSYIRTMIFDIQVCVFQDGHVAPYFYRHRTISRKPGAILDSPPHRRNRPIWSQVRRRVTPRSLMLNILSLRTLFLIFGPNPPKNTRGIRPTRDRFSLHIMNDLGEGAIALVRLTKRIYVFPAQDRTG